jgi:hypothetical protein
MGPMTAADSIPSTPQERVETLVSPDEVRQRSSWTTGCGSSFHPKIVVVRKGRAIAVPTACDDPNCYVLSYQAHHRAFRMTEAVVSWSNHHDIDASGVRVHDFKGSATRVRAALKKAVQRDPVGWGYAFPAHSHTDDLESLYGSIIVFRNVPLRPYSKDSLYGAYRDIPLHEATSYMGHLIRHRLPKHRISAWNLYTSDPRRRDCPGCEQETWIWDQTTKRCHWDDSPTTSYYQRIGWTKGNLNAEDLLTSQGYEVSASEETSSGVELFNLST